ncbi:hypothetical protein AAMO2058_000185700 [Amorphochlora amoebiformis]|uniref:Uncharacterized protein n=1 Tax=Amorphochlora amoebiformis TaxID=1561963 RepID=A0A7S0GYA9_9EUKA|mmetsp:Transcript_19921/g.31584  ORF Transcript_19921/g.31584 Transcript_19921/m.31584 type:complete len:132 (+) Transcript_19921:47-442(+)|eukprot:1392905-Amorphochlora_amoeboformis.AAC.1
MDIPRQTSFSKEGKSESLPRIPMLGEDFKFKGSTRSVPVTPSRRSSKSKAMQFPRPPLLRRRKGWRQLPHIQVPGRSDKMGIVTPLMPTPLQNAGQPILELDGTPINKRSKPDAYEVLLTPAPPKGMEISN